MKLYPGKRVYARVSVETEPERIARRRRMMKWEYAIVSAIGIGTAVLLMQALGGFR